MGRIFLGNIKGPKGDTGEKGETGKQGNIGPVGPPGIIDGNTPIEFTEAESYVNVESSESIAIGFGKIRKNISGILNGAISSLLGKNLSANKVLISDINGKVAASTITAEELGYLDGVVKNIQEQIGDLLSLKTAEKESLTGAVNELNGKISGIEGKTIFTSVVGTTDSSGLITIQCNNAFTSYPFVLSNVSDTLATPYSVTVNSYSKTSISLRIRNMGDNSAVANKTVNFTVLLIGK